MENSILEGGLRKENPLVATKSSSWKEGGNEEDYIGVEEGELGFDIGLMSSKVVGHKVNVAYLNHFSYGAILDLDEGFKVVHHRKGKKILVWQ